MMKEIKIATRKSILALWQSEHIKARIEAQHKGMKVVLEGMKTKGDVILDTPLAKIGGKGLFTKELEDSMLKGETDIAVHSLKDVPVEFPQGLVLAAICAREDGRDAMISEKYAKFNELPRGAKVGTTSLRRKMQLLSMRPDLEVISLRGNVQTRLRRLKDGEFDAIILAMAGINRLNLCAEVRHVAPFEVSQMIPAMGQGALGIEAVDEPQTLRAIEFLKDERVKKMMSNQGLYNGFLASGLMWSLTESGEFQFQIAIFFLICIICAAIYGSVTVSKKIFLLQGIPALLAIMSLLLPLLFW